MGRGKKKKQTASYNLPSENQITNVALKGKPSLTEPFNKWMENIEKQEEAEYQRIIRKYGSIDNYYKALWNNSLSCDGEDYDDSDIPDPYNYRNECETDSDEYKIKHIYFYTEYDDESTAIEFTSVKEFDDYCNDMGYSVNKADAMDIAYCDEYHCALNPYETILYNKEVVIGAETYDDLSYRCQELEYYGNLDEEEMDTSFSTTW